jgi:hypothetical protein
MKHSAIRLVVLIGALLGIAAPICAQQPPAPEPAPPAAAAAPPGPSAELLKRAKSVGMRPETRNGAAVYCWEDADTGSRFKTKKCVDQSRLEDMVQRRELQQDQLRQNQH